MSDKIKVIQYGLGPIGSRTTKYLLERPNIEIIGAIDIAPDKVGKDVAELAGKAAIGVKVSDDADGVMKNSGADIVALTTTSDVVRAKGQILGIVRCGLNVVSTCEELAYPWDTQPELSTEIDQAATDAAVSVLGTGVNPGFLMDLLPLSLTAICRKVESVTIERIQNAAFRRLPFQKKIGAGLTPEEFQQKIDEGTLRHVGLTESMHMIAAKLGWKLDKTEDIIQPILAEEPVESSAMTIDPGKALGVFQLGRGWMNGQLMITLDFRAGIGQPEPRDRVIIKGDPSIDSIIPGGVNGDVATCAIVVNAIPTVVAARPGLRTMADIEPASCLW